MTATQSVVQIKAALEEETRKLRECVEVLVKSHSQQAKEEQQVLHEELLMKFDAIMVRLDVLEKIYMEKKKPIKTAKSDDAAPATAATKTTTTTSAAEDNKLPTYNNYSIYFKAEFKKNPEFRNKYMTPALQELVDKDAGIKAATKAEQKLNKTAALVFEHLKKDAAKQDAIKQEFNVYKAALAVKPATKQETVEAPSDDDV